MAKRLFLEISVKIIHELEPTNQEVIPKSIIFVILIK